MVIPARGSSTFSRLLCNDEELAHVRPQARPPTKELSLAPPTHEAEDD